MHDGIEGVRRQHSIERNPVTDISDHQLRGARDRLPVPMHQVVQHYDGMTRFEQFGRHYRPDVSRSACDEDPHAHLSYYLLPYYVLLWMVV